MSEHLDKDTANAIFIFAGAGLIWLLVGWKWALGAFLVVVSLTQLAILTNRKTND
jgi:hypothetical protein